MSLRKDSKLCRNLDDAVGLNDSLHNHDIRTRKKTLMKRVIFGILSGFFPSHLMTQWSKCMACEIFDDFVNYFQQRLDERVTLMIFSDWFPELIKGSIVNELIGERYFCS